MKANEIYDENEEAGDCLHNKCGVLFCTDEFVCKIIGRFACMAEKYVQKSCGNDNSSFGNNKGQDKP